jgi:hypothetical protein
LEGNFGDGTPSYLGVVCESVAAGLTKFGPPNQSPSLGTGGFTLAFDVTTPYYPLTVLEHVDPGRTLPDITIDIGKTCPVTITLADIGVALPDKSVGPDAIVIVPASLPVGATGQIPANGSLTTLKDGTVVPNLRYAYGGVYKVFQDRQGNQYLVVFNKDENGNIVLDGNEPIIPRDGSIFAHGSLANILPQFPGGEELLTDPNPFAIFAVSPSSSVPVPAGLLQAAGFDALQAKGGTVPHINPSTLIGYPGF